MWSLIIALMHSNGAAITHVEFQNRDACVVAATAIAENTKENLYGARSLTCVYTGTRR